MHQNGPSIHATTPRLVTAEVLRTTLWDKESAPSLRWIRSQQKARTIPFIKIQRRVFFNPEEVLAALQTRTIKPRA